MKKANLVPLLSLRKLTKRYPALVANDRIDLDVIPASIHAILGENGAGKSTLMKLTYGVIEPDEGELFWEGKKIKQNNTFSSRKRGIGMLFQHFSLFETLSVVENISLTIPGNRKILSERIKKVGAAYNMIINPEALVFSLSVGERQRIEIIRCLMQDLKLLILDEPTSVLPPQHVRSLFHALRKLRDSGVAILYISHKLEEIIELCDTATILQDGKVTGTVNPNERTVQELATLMIGRNIPQTKPRTEKRLTDTPILKISNLDAKSDNPFSVNLSRIDLKVHGGEIVGIAGVSGNGQKELSRVLSGEDLSHNLHPKIIEMMGKPVADLGVSDRRRLGFSFVPEERLGRGAIAPMTLSENALLTAYGKDMLDHGFIRNNKIEAFTKKCISDFDVRCRGTNVIASSLSGGNLQKFIVGRELSLLPKLLFLAQPTWGVDIGSATAIRQRLLDLRDQGVAILVISEELEELFEISDRLYVIHNGQISPSLMTAEIKPDDIGEYMIGIRNVSNNSIKGNNANQV